MGALSYWAVGQGMAGMWMKGKEGGVPVFFSVDSWGTLPQAAGA